MLDAASGIEVYIQPSRDGAPFQEYAAPRHSPLYTGKKNEAYIEAVTNQRFGIAVKLRDDFDFMGCSDVKVWYSIDGIVKMHSCFAKVDKATVNSHWTGELKRRVGGEWRRHGFSFGELVPVDDLDLTQQQEDTESEERGLIRISVTRGRRVWKKYVPLSSDSPQDLAMQTSKKVAVDQGRSHALRSLDLGSCPTETRLSLFTPSARKAGTQIDFTFRYASRMILELKKIVPFETTPPPLVTAVPGTSSAPAVKDGSVQQASRVASATQATASQAGKKQSHQIPAPVQPNSKRPAPFPKQDEDDDVVTFGTPPFSATRTIDRKIQSLPDRDLSIARGKRVKAEHDDDELVIVSESSIDSARIKREAGIVSGTVPSEPARKKVKAKSEGTATTRTPSAAPSATAEGAVSRAQGAKAKEKARLQLELEELRIQREEQRIQREENKLKRELMELEDE